MPLSRSVSNSFHAASPWAFCRPSSRSSEAPDSAGSGMVTACLKPGPVRSAQSRGSGVPLLVFQTMPSAEMPWAT